MLSELIKELKEVEDEMSEKDHEFFTCIYNRWMVYNESTWVSDAQMKWLTDLKKRYTTEEGMYSDYD